MSYLVSEGRANEHAEQHLVAGDPAIVAFYGYDQLDAAAAAGIAHDLDEPRRLFGVEVTRQTTVEDPVTGELVAQRMDANVWHCSLSLHAEEGQLSDERWAAIATEFVRRMEFAGDGIGRADCRWVAVRHGLSKNGNDHVHIAVSLVREDGTKASVHNDQPRAQRISRELEREFGLRPLHESDRERGQRGEKPAERETARRRAGAEVAPRRLERAVRSSATSALDEGEFVRRLRREGVLIRPRFAAGRGDVVTGYSVALRPEQGEHPVWYSGGRIARDLTLPALRNGWPDRPDSASDAVAEWRATSKNPWRYTPAQPGREEAELSGELFEKYAAEMTRLHEFVQRIDPTDQASWAHVARETAGAYAAWSRRLEPTPGPLADASRALARSAQLRAHETRPRPAGMPSMAAAAALIAASANGRSNAAAEALLLRQLAGTTAAIFRAAKAAGDARRAAELAAVMRNKLTVVRDGYEATIRGNELAALTPEERARMERTAQVTGRGTPLPTPLQASPEQSRHVSTTRPSGTHQRDGHER